MYRDRVCLTCRRVYPVTEPGPCPACKGVLRTVRHPKEKRLDYTKRPPRGGYF